MDLTIMQSKLGDTEESLTVKEKLIVTCTNPVI